MQYRNFTRRTKHIKRQRKNWFVSLRPSRIWASFGLAMVLVGVIIGSAALWQLKKSEAGSHAYQKISEVEDTSELISIWHKGWFALPGAEWEDDGLRINPIPFQVVEQDGSGGRPNPPVNLYGAHLRTGGDFGIRAKLQGVTGKASLSLYGQVPIIFDEFRYEHAALHLTFDGNRLLVETWEANKAAPLKEFPLDDITARSILRDVEIIRKDGLVSFSVNKTKLGDIPEGSLFAGGTVWFGAAAEKSAWLLASLRAERLGDAELEIVDSSTLNIRDSHSWRHEKRGLQELVNDRRRGFTLGAAVALGPLAADKEYAQVALGGNFGSFTTENALKWQFVHPAPDTYDFHETDAIVDLARRHNIRIHGHTLVFGEANPVWVQRLPIATPADKQHVQQVMLDHIAKVVDRYKGKISTWDVINEPVADYEQFYQGGGELRDHVWYRAMGEDYMAKAFRTAHKADPDAKLFINDYGLEEDGERWDAFYALVKRLKQQGVPIDGVGFQAHVYERADRISTDVLRAHIQALDRLGLQSRISEIDVYADDGLTVQADEYSQVLKTCLELSSCVSYTTWGVSDRYNMWRDDDSLLQNGQDFLWDRAMQPTPAVEAIRKTLED